MLRRRLGAERKWAAAVSSADFDLAFIDRLEREAQAHPEKLELLTPAQRVQAAVDIMGARDAVHAKDCWRWMCDRVWTIDEASQAKVAWPRKPYLHDMVKILDGEQMVAFPKSRRVMATWTVATWAVHRARFHPNNTIFWQSENEDKAAFVVHNRCAYVEDNIEPRREGELSPYHRTYSSIKTTKGLIGRMTYRLTKSGIWAVPQGADALRTFTPSVLVMDESEFQQEAHQALVAALPFVEKSTRLVLISSSNGPLGIIAGIAKELGFTSYAVSA